MIDAERMLGSLVRNAMSGKRRGKRRKRGVTSMLGRGAKGGLALGALGVAFGLYEHLSNKPSASGSWNASGPPQSPTTTPPPPSSSDASNLPPLPVTAKPDLPPLPTAGAAPQTPAAPTADSPPSADPNEALLLVRAMIAAANADHEVDDDERDRILRSLEESGLGNEDKQFVLAELESPKAPAALAAEATTPELASQIYLASLMAIEVDSNAEEAYLKRLAQELGLDDARVAELESLLAEGSN